MNDQGGGMDLIILHFRKFLNSQAGDTATSEPMQYVSL